MRTRTRGWQLSLLPLAILSGTFSIALVALQQASAESGKATVLPMPKFSKDVVDLFFDDARNQIGPGQPGGTPAPQGKKPDGNSGGGDSGGGAPVGNWSQLVSSDSLEQEVKSLIPQAEEATKTPAVFKSKGREQAQTVFTELSTLFAVIGQYDGDVKWKKDALGWRTKLAHVANNCKTSSDAAFKGAQVAVGDLKNLLNGQNVDVPKAEGEFEWGKEILRSSLMKRFETARTERLGAWTSDKSAFTKNKDNLLKEAQILAMLAKVIREPTFDNGDDEAYLKYASEFQKECQALVDAVKTDNQPNAQSALSRISKSCDSCHGEFR
jgi:cytochrome c556